MSPPDSSAIRRLTNLSESSIIFAVGAATLPRHGANAWFEAGSALDYHTGHVTPDYRGGVPGTRAVPISTAISTRSTSAASITTFCCTRNRVSVLRVFTGT
jgi:hypothetical protein